MNNVELIAKLLQENQKLKEDYDEAVHKVTEFESKVYELQEVIEKAQDLIRNETSLNEQEIDELSEILDSYR